MKRRTVVAYVAAVAALMLAGCSGGSDDEDTAGSADEAAAVAPQNDDDSGGMAREEGEAAEEAPADDSAGDGAGSSDDGGGVIDQVRSESLDRSIIYTISLVIEAEDVDDAAQRAASIATGRGGFVADEHTTDDSSTLTLKVPVGQHDDAVAALQDVGTVTDRSRSTQDVTQEVVDTESRIESQRESIARIRTLLSEAQDIGDVISIESELAAREADLDALLSRQEQLSNLTSMATINVTFELPGEADEDDDTSDAGGFVGGLRDGWDAFTGAWSVAATVVGAMLPFLVFAAVVGVPVWMLLRRRRADVPQVPQVEQP